MTVNEMIYEALTTDSRKKKAKWQMELESLGYKVIKDGSWYISNPKTGKWIDLPYNETNYLRTSKGYIRFGYQFRRKYKPLNVINFVGILNSDKNISVYRNGDDVNINMYNLANDLHNRKYHQKELDNAMNEYQTTIDLITKEYQTKLSNAKEHYDWSVKYHSEAIESTTKEINKILKRDIDK